MAFEKQVIENKLHYDYGKLSSVKKESITDELRRNEMQYFDYQENLEGQKMGGNNELFGLNDSFQRQQVNPNTGYGTLQVTKPKQNVFNFSKKSL